MFSLTVVGVGGGPPPHRHLAEDDLFYRMQGARSLSRPAAATRTVPENRSLLHEAPRTDTGTGATSPPMVAVYTPSGMEGWFREALHSSGGFGRDPPPVTPELIQRIEAGPRQTVEWLD